MRRTRNRFGERIRATSLYGEEQAPEHFIRFEDEVSPEALAVMIEDTRKYQKLAKTERGDDAKRKFWFRMTALGKFLSLDEMTDAGLRNEQALALCWQSTKGKIEGVDYAVTDRLSDQKHHNFEFRGYCEALNDIRHILPERYTQWRDERLKNSIVERIKYGRANKDVDTLTSGLYGAALLYPEELKSELEQEEDRRIIYDALQNNKEFWSFAVASVPIIFPEHRASIPRFNELRQSHQVDIDERRNDPEWWSIYLEAIWRMQIATAPIIERTENGIVFRYTKAEKQTALPQRPSL